VGSSEVTTAAPAQEEMAAASGSAGKDAAADDAPSLSSDKLQALQELGLSLEEAVQMGLVPASAGGMEVDAEG